VPRPWSAADRTVVLRKTLRRVTDVGPRRRWHPGAVSGAHPITLAIDSTERPLNLAWFAILFTGRYPRGLLDFVVAVGRWHLRVVGYAYALVTDAYPPFRLGP
jgi:hypothetical protein